MTTMHDEIATQTQLLPNRVALITGGSRGIGAATATLFARHGAAVAVNYLRNEEAARQVVDGIVAAGGRAIAIQADVRDQRQVEAMAHQAHDAFGPIDTLILNAAVASGFTPSPIVRQRWEDLARDAAEWLRAALLPIQAVLPAMVERRDGSIVVVGSALTRQPVESFGALGVTKAGVDALARSLAQELGPQGIRVNTVAPGTVLTDLTRFIPQQQQEAIAAYTPLRRLAQPADVAGAILLLASDQTRFVTGAYLPVSGGLHIL